MLSFLKICYFVGLGVCGVMLLGYFISYMKIRKEVKKDGNK